MGLLITAQSLNTFFVVYHAFDTTDSEQTLRYTLGQIGFMTFFFIQTGMLIGTWVYAFIIYYKLATFLKPPSEADIVDDHLSSHDDDYSDASVTEYQRKRDVIR